MSQTFDDTRKPVEVPRWRVAAQIRRLGELDKATLGEMFRNEQPDDGHARVLRAYESERVYNFIAANLHLATPSGAFFCLCEIGDSGRRLHALFWMYKLALAET